MKLGLVDGGRLENIEISRIVMENVGCPIFIRLGDRGNTYGKGGKAPVGTLKNVHISDLVANVTIASNGETPSSREIAKAGPIMIAGIPGHYVENVELENIKISYPGHGTEADTKRVVPEDENKYPEQYFFGVLPAWGAYIRHAKNIEFNNVELTFRGADERQKIVLDDVEGFVER